MEVDEVWLLIYMTDIWALTKVYMLLLSLSSSNVSFAWMYFCWWLSFWDQVIWMLIHQLWALTVHGSQWRWKFSHYLRSCWMSMILWVDVLHLQHLLLLLPKSWQGTEISFMSIARFVLRLLISRSIPTSYTNYIDIVFICFCLKSERCMLCDILIRLMAC